MDIESIAKYRRPLINRYSFFLEKKKKNYFYVEALYTQYVFLILVLPMEKTRVWSVRNHTESRPIVATLNPIWIISDAQHNPFEFC